jgi:hypothetical protein
MTLSTGILIGDSVWHAAAAWHFLFFPERTLLRTTRERPANRIAMEVFRFLGAMNAALSVFALLMIRLPQTEVWPALVGFALVEVSQFAVDWRVARLRLVGGPMFKTIFWGDGIFWWVNLAGALVYLSQ